jgi:hypothetical protein
MIKVHNYSSYIKETNNDELILTLKIPNINNYKQIIENDELLLIPNCKYITLNELIKLDVTNTNISNCIITKSDDEIISNNQSRWFRVLIDIYKSLPASFILQNTTFNIKLTNECGKKGYTWCPEICMSIQRKDANDTLKEIINMIQLMKYRIDIKIYIKSNDSYVNYKNY